MMLPRQAPHAHLHVASDLLVTPHSELQKKTRNTANRAATQVALQSPESSVPQLLFFFLASVPTARESPLPPRASHSKSCTALVRSGTQTAQTSSRKAKRYSWQEQFHFTQRVVHCQTEQERHEPVSLFSSLMLRHLPTDTMLIFPRTRCRMCIDGPDGGLGSTNVHISNCSCCDGLNSNTSSGMGLTCSRGLLSRMGARGAPVNSCRALDTCPCWTLLWAALPLSAFTDFITSRFSDPLSQTPKLWLLKHWDSPEEQTTEIELIQR